MVVRVGNIRKHSIVDSLFSRKLNQTTVALEVSIVNQLFHMSGTMKSNLVVQNHHVHPFSSIFFFMGESSDSSRESIRFFLEEHHLSMG